ncbi:MAG: hypothetical protein KJO31_05185 [Gammaproteobacteria bacterium]|nr:hypothetical protein [Gammaproteobacteria bacterium]
MSPTDKTLRLAMLLALLPFAAALAQSDDPPGPEPAIRYEIVGNPVVGQPVAINLYVIAEATDAIVLDYRIMDTSSLQFPESQPRQVELKPGQNGAATRQQVTVVPQREGRLFLNVSSTLQGESGPVIRAAAIPIQVSAAPRGGSTEPDAAAGEPDAS